MIFLGIICLSTFLITVYSLYRALYYSEDGWFILGMFGAAAFAITSLLFIAP